MIFESAKEQYRELLALTQLYLLQEHRLDQRIFSEATSYAYFKELAMQRRQQQPAAPAPQKTAPPPPLPRATPLIQPPPPPPKAIVTPPAVEAIAQPPEPPAPTPKVEASPPPKHQPTAPITTGFELQPMTAPVAHDLTEARTLIQKEFPQLTLMDQPPSDAIAKQQMNQWKLEHEPPVVLILTFNETDKPLQLLKNMAKAIQLTIGTVKLISAEAIEKENGWEALLKSSELRLVITSDYGIYSLTELMKHYKEDARRNRRFLDAVPLLLLPDLNVYLKEPLLKPSLWRSLCETLKSL